MYDFIAIDFETATEQMNSACSLGIVCVDNFEIVDKKYFMIQPPNNIYNPYNSEVHGISAKDTLNSPTFDIVWNQIEPLFHDCIVVAHNARFDMSVLKSCLDNYSIALPDFQYIDSIAISNRVIKDKAYSKTLIDRAAYFEIPITDHHNALSDAIVCAKIVIASVQTTNRKSLKTYCSSFRRRTTHLFSELKPMDTFPQLPYHKRTKITDLTPRQEISDTSNPLYNKNVVITGDFTTLTRTAVMQKVIDVGGIVKSGVSSKTNFLIVGVQNSSLVKENGLSTKERKAKELIEKGHNITFLNEQEFLELIK